MNGRILDMRFTSIQFVGFLTHASKIKVPSRDTTEVVAALELLSVQLGIVRPNFGRMTG